MSVEKHFICLRSRFYVLSGLVEWGKLVPQNHSFLMFSATMASQWKSQFDDDDETENELENETGCEASQGRYTRDV